MQLPLPQRVYSASATQPGFQGSQLGIPASEAQAALQSDAYKELVNKLAWALGSSYRMPYTNMRTLARVWACDLAKQTIIEHGYPSAIGYPK